jgi:hypothetical protein
MLGYWDGTTFRIHESDSGGGGGTDWTADQRSAISAILGIPASGTTPESPSAGGVKAIADTVNHADYGNAKLVRSTTPANTLSVDANHKIAVPDTQKVDVYTIKTQSITCGAAVTINPQVGQDNKILTNASGHISRVVLTDLATATTSVTNAVTVGTNNDKTGYGLSSAERTTLAAALEAAIINELDGTAVMQAIADLIASPT